MRSKVATRLAVIPDNVFCSQVLLVVTGTRGLKLKLVKAKIN